MPGLRPLVLINGEIKQLPVSERTDPSTTLIEINKDNVNIGEARVINIQTGSNVNLNATLVDGVLNLKIDSNNLVSGVDGTYKVTTIEVVDTIPEIASRVANRLYAKRG